jgi:hypothetical protein
MNQGLPGNLTLEPTSCYNESDRLIFRLEILEIHKTPALTVSSEADIRGTPDMGETATTAD